jgi:hypothetical protein
LADAVAAATKNTVDASVQGGNQQQGEPLVTAAITARQRQQFITDYKTDPLYPTRVLKPGWVAAAKQVVAAGKVIRRDRKVMADVAAATTATAVSNGGGGGPSAIGAEVAPDGGVIRNRAEKPHAKGSKASKKAADVEPDKLTTVLLHLPKEEVDRLKVGLWCSYFLSSSEHGCAQSDLQNMAAQVELFYIRPPPTRHHQ